MISKIELREKLAGYRRVDDGNGGFVNEDVYQDHWQLMVDDGPGGAMRQAGYVWKNPDSYITFIRTIDPPDAEAIAKLVSEKAGERLAMVQPPEMPDDEQDDEEEESDDDEE